MKGELALVFPRRKLGQACRDQDAGPVWVDHAMVASLAVAPLTSAAKYLVRIDQFALNLRVSCVRMHMHIGGVLEGGFVSENTYE